jgi:hypothetical protein
MNCWSAESGSALHLEATAAYVAAAEQEAERRGHRGRVHFRHGDFVSLASDLGSAELVTLDRVVCCYPELEPLVSLSAEKAERYYALSFPHNRWYVRAHTWWQNHRRRRAGRRRHRSEVVEYRVDQHLDRLGDRLLRLGLMGPLVTENVTGNAGPRSTKNPAPTEVEAGQDASRERATGLEPATSSLGSWHSTTELRPRYSPTTT